MTTGRSQEKFWQTNAVARPSIGFIDATHGASGARAACCVDESVSATVNGR